MDESPGAPDTISNVLLISRTIREEGGGGLAVIPGRLY